MKFLKNPVPMEKVKPLITFIIHKISQKGSLGQNQVPDQHEKRKFLATSLGLLSVLPFVQFFQGERGNKNSIWLVKAHLKSLVIKEPVNNLSVQKFFDMHYDSEVENLNFNFLKFGRMIYISYKFDKDKGEILAIKCFFNKSHMEKFLHHTMLKYASPNSSKMRLISLNKAPLSEKKFKELKRSSDSYAEKFFSLYG